MALLLVGFGLKDSIFDIAVLQYEEIQLYDGNVILEEDASSEEKEETYDKLVSDKRVEETAENFLQQVEVTHGKEKQDVYLNVPKDVNEFSDFVIFKDRVTGERYELDDSGAHSTLTLIISCSSEKMMEFSFIS